MVKTGKKWFLLKKNEDEDNIKISVCELCAILLLKEQQIVKKKYYSLIFTIFMLQHIYSIANKTQQIEWEQSDQTKAFSEELRNTTFFLHFEAKQYLAQNENTMKVMKVMKES